MSVHPKLSSINDQFTSDVAQAEPVPMVVWYDRPIPVKGQHFKHTKTGNIYIVHDTAVCANNHRPADEPDVGMVSYREMGQTQVYFRDIEEFLGLGADGGYRFLRMVPVNPDCEE